MTEPTPEDDAVLHLIAAQSDKRLIVPDDLTHMPELRDALEGLCNLGLCFWEPWQGMCGLSKLYKLTREGWERWGKLTDTIIHFE